MRVIWLLLLAGAAWADATVASQEQGLLFREVSAAARLGDRFDPREVDPHHLGQYVEVYLSYGTWEAFLGEDDEDCCQEPDYVKPPVWKNGVLRLQQAEGRGFYACAKGDHPAPPTRQNREVLIVTRQDGGFDVTLCGRRLTMVRGQSYDRRYQEWSRATAENIIGDAAWARGLDCRTVAVECDQKRLAAACPLPFKRTLLLERGRAPMVLPPRSDWAEASQLEAVMAESDPPSVWCVWRAGGPVHQ